MTDIDYMVACLLIPIAYVIVYIAGKYDVITLFIQILTEKVEEMTRKENEHDGENN